jgi:predicted transcriptional regulator
MASKNLSPIGLQIDAIRQRRAELTLYRVAKNAKMDYSQFYRVMRGKIPARDTLLRICRALGCNLNEANEIFSLTEYREPTQQELDEDIRQPACA